MTKRIYDPPEKSDGYRLLADRLWPRGMKKEDACLDAWARDLAPTTALRKWFGHDPAKWKQFRKSYLKELGGNDETPDWIRTLSGQEVITLLTASRELSHCHVQILKEFLEKQL